MTPALLPAQGGHRDGPRQSDPPATQPPGHRTGGAAHPPPPPPGYPAGGRPHPAPGAAPRSRGNAYTWGVCAGDERGTGQRAAGRPPQMGEVGSHSATRRLSLQPPHRPTSQGGAGPPPAQGRHTDRARRQQASTNRSGMGATPSIASATPRTPALVPALGRQRDGPRQGAPPPHWPSRPLRRGERRTAPPPPPPHPPALEHLGQADPPHGKHTAPSQVGGIRDRATPPPPSKPNGARDRGRTRRGAQPYQRSAPGPRGVRAPHQPGQGGGARTRRHTHTNDTRGRPEGQPDRACETHRPHGIAHQRARIRDTRTGRPATHSAGTAGREGRNGEDRTPGTGPSPSYPPRAPRRHDQGTAAAKAVVAHRATHQPQG